MLYSSVHNSKNSMIGFHVVNMQMAPNHFQGWSSIPMWTRTWFWVDKSFHKSESFDFLFFIFFYLVNWKRDVMIIRVNDIAHYFNINVEKKKSVVIIYSQLIGFIIFLKFVMMMKWVWYTRMSVKFLYTTKFSSHEFVFSFIWLPSCAWNLNTETLSIKN